jgi:hypothetical protein
MSESNEQVGVSSRDASAAPIDRPAHVPASPGEPSGADRRASVWDVLHGLEVREFAETQPSDVWEQLFPAKG